MLEVAFKADAECMGTLLWDRDYVRRFTDVVPSEISISHPGKPGRFLAERLIEDVYAREFGGRIVEHYPLLINARDEAGRVIAAAGLRFAEDGPLFLETYLGHPVEQSISKAAGRQVARKDIVEIGNLAAANRGASVFIFATLAAYLRALDFSYATATATKGLRRSFARHGIEVMELAPASASALPDHGADWGSYYMREPKVLAGPIAPAFDCLETYLPSPRNADLGRLFSPSLLQRREIVQ